MAGFNSINYDFEDNYGYGKEIKVIYLSCLAIKLGNQRTRRTEYLYTFHDKSY